ncbi:MAG: hypothetical protein AABW86_00390 [Candidatus Micrarchaeota archaeon]
MQDVTTNECLGALKTLGNNGKVRDLTKLYAPLLILKQKPIWKMRCLQE